MDPCAYHTDTALMRVLAVAAGVAFLAAVASPSARADEPDFARPGFYLGGGATYGINLIESAFDDLFSDVEVGDTWGFNTHVGYRPLRWLALEAEYEYLHNFGVQSDGFHLADLRAQ